MHYYDPLPDFREVTRKRVVAQRIPRGIDFRTSEQVALARLLGESCMDELRGLRTGPDRVLFDNDYFTGLDAATYYSVIRHLKPRRIIEVGGGFSTRIASLALERNRADGRSGELTCIEPYPQKRMGRMGNSFRLIEQRLEDSDEGLFLGLESGDILFIDSSHSVKWNGDVNRLILEILPIIAEGVWVHIHDIFLPDDYPAEWLIERRLAFTEQYLVQAFLAFNPSWVLRLSNHWLAKVHREAVHCLCPDTTVAEEASSFWIERCGNVLAMYQP